MTERQFRRYSAALILFAAFLAYANTFANDFVWDDASSVLLHKDVQDPSRILQLFTRDQHAFGRGQGNFYRPLVSVSFMLDTWLSRPAAPPQGTAPGPFVLGPFLFHLSNTLWHAAAGLALFALMTVFGAPRPVRVLAALLYVVHPLHSEAIAYISGRADPMAAAFTVLGLCCALALPKNRNVIWTAIFFVAALLSKESAAVFPFILLFAVLVMRKAPDAAVGHAAAARNAYVPLAVSGAIIGIYAALRLTVLRFASSAESTAPPITERIKDAGQAFALYLKLIFAPTGLHMERTLSGVPGWLAPAGWILIALFAAITIAAYSTKRNRLAFALGFFLITWFPISGIFPLNAPMAEHWMYLPLMGFVWAFFEVVWMLVAIRPLRYPVYAAGYVACLAFMVLTAQRNHDWRNNESLYVATLQESPNSIRVNYNLGVTYDDLLGNSSGARRQYERVLDLYKAMKENQGGTGQTEMFYDDETEAHLSLGKLYVERQMANQAASHFETLRRINVNDRNASVIESAYVEYAKLLIAVGRPDDARSLIAEGIGRVPALKQQKEAAERISASTALDTPPSMEDAAEPIRTDQGE